MRLRYLHLSHYPPLADLAVAFSPRAPWAAFEPQGGPARLAIHFVIGQTGSGKSHLLRARAESFLALADERVPRSPVSLIYELGRPGEPGHRTLIFDCPGEAHATTMWQAEGWAFPDTTDREAFAQAITHLRTVERTPEARGLAAARGWRGARCGDAVARSRHQPGAPTRLDGGGRGHHRDR